MLVAHGFQHWRRTRELQRARGHACHATRRLLKRDLLPTYIASYRPGGGTGRRSGLKIRRAQALEGSSPSPGMWQHRVILATPAARAGRYGVGSLLR